MSNHLIICYLFCRLQIRTTAPAAVFSEKIVFNDAGIPYVEEISQVHEATGNIVIKFTPPKLPPFVLKRGRYDICTTTIVGEFNCI